MKLALVRDSEKIRVAGGGVEASFYNIMVTAETKQHLAKRNSLNWIA
jgi:hypothetical protein